MKKKIVDEAINGFLLAVVTINAFVDFLPKSVATVLGLLILCKLLYKYLPAITRKLYETSKGTFTEKWWIRLLILCFAVPGYFITFLSQHIAPLLFVLIAAVLILGFPLAYAWNKENKGIPPNQQSFWKVMAGGQRKNLAEEWEKYKNAPNKLSAFCWYYAPGVCLSAMGFCFFAIFLLISWYSQFFTLVFIGWLLGKDINKKLLKLASALKAGWKGTFGFACIFAGFAIPGMFIAYELANFPFSNAVNFQYPLYSSIVNLFLQLPPFLYQFVFWYAILKRFPCFLHCWQSGFQKDKTLSLPTGQIYAFVGSCVAPFYIFIAPSMLQRLFPIRPYYLVFSLWFIISFAFIALIVHTLIKWRGEKTSEDVYTDNIKIPLAVFAQFMLLFGAGYVLEKSILSEMSLTSLLISIVLIILFFVDDWENRWKHRYGEGLISDIFGILLPVFVILTLVNFITFVWLQPIFYLELVLSIIVVSLIILDMGKYRVLCRALLHKFCISLTNTIFQSSNIIKEYCNRLFLVLKRKEVINKAINGFLLAIVTVNTFVHTIPKFLKYLTDPDNWDSTEIIEEGGGMNKNMLKSAGVYGFLSLIFFLIEYILNFTMNYLCECDNLAIFSVGLWVAIINFAFLPPIWLGMSASFMIFLRMLIASLFDGLSQRIGTVLMGILLWFISLIVTVGELGGFMSLMIGVLFIFGGLIFIYEGITGDNEIIETFQL